MSTITQTFDSVRLKDLTRYVYILPFPKETVQGLSDGDMRVTGELFKSGPSAQITTFFRNSRTENLLGRTMADSVGK